MHNQSPFVKLVIWFMIFLMSVGFAALVVTPFIGGGSFFSGDGGRGATEDLVDEARADVRQNNCADPQGAVEGDRLERCKEALIQLASSYRTLASGNEDGSVPRDARRNVERSNDAYQALYELDPTDDDSAELYASSLRDNGKAQASLNIWTQLVKRNPEEEDYLLQQAASYEGTQQVDQAIATYEVFLRRFPDSGQIDAIKDQITGLEELQAQAAAGGVGGPGAAGAGGPGGITATGPDGQPISIG